MKIERCRSHEVDSNPQAWEVVFEGKKDQIHAELESRMVALGASGDQLRVVVGDVTYSPTEFFHVFG